jgi:hypothetical protein
MFILIIISREVCADVAILLTDEESLYKPVPPPKPAPNNQKSQDGQQDESLEQAVAERSSLRTSTSGQERSSSIAEDGQIRNAAGQPFFAPEYRMPPLYGEEQSSGQAQQAAGLQTHSSKFPVSDG